MLKPVLCFRVCCNVCRFPSSTISAMWDQEGGFKCDQHGITTKEWRWLPGLAQMEKIVIQVRPQWGSVGLPCL